MTKPKTETPKNNKTETPKNNKTEKPKTEKPKTETPAKPKPEETKPKAPVKPKTAKPAPAKAAPKKKAPAKPKIPKVPKVPKVPQEPPPVTIKLINPKKDPQYSPDSPVNLANPAQAKANVNPNAIVVPYQESPKQALFHGSATTETFFGGAKGGGKSLSLVMDTLAYALEFPGSVSYLFRETYDDLEANLIFEWKNIVPDKLYKYNESKHEAKIVNGSIVRFRYVANYKDAEHYQGRSIDYIGIDELTKHEEKTVQELLSCLRSAKGFPPTFKATGNPGGKGHCVPFGEVMTPDGWIDISLLKVGSPVYAVDKDGGLVPTKVGQVHKHEYNGDLWTANMRGLNITCTPEHRIAKVGGTKKGRNSTFSLVEAKNLPGQAYVLRSVKYEGKDINAFKVPYYKTRKRRLAQPTEITGNQYAELMGWYLSEGCTIGRDKAFAIAQMKEPQRSRIRELLQECNFVFSEGIDGFIAYAPDWWHYLKMFGKCRGKYIPCEIKNASREQLRIFFNAAMDGDGHWATRGRSGQYYTASKQLADDVSEIAVKLGYSVCLSSRQRTNRIGLSYTVNFDSYKKTEILTGNHIYGVSTTTKRKSDVQMVPFNGTVYDIGVPEYHTFIIRQNGSVWVSGNSWVKSRYIVPTNYGKKQYTDIETGNTISFIPSTVYDNPAIMKNDPAYVRRLENLPEAKRRAYLLGDWDVYTGQGFPEWSEKIHVCDNFEPPEHWVRWRCLDNGYSDPFYWGWLTVSPEGIVYLYREFTRTPDDPKLLYTEQAEKVVELSKHTILENGRATTKAEKTNCTVAGVDAWNTHHRDQSGKSLVDYYAEGGVNNLIKAVTDRKLRKDTFHEYLKPIPEVNMNTGEETGEYYAKFQVMRRCKKFIEFMPELVEDEDNPDVIADCDYDHAFDSVGYGIIFHHSKHSKSLTPTKSRIQAHKEQKLKKYKQTRTWRL